MFEVISFPTGVEQLEFQPGFLMPTGLQRHVHSFSNTSTVAAPGLCGPGVIIAFPCGSLVLPNSTPCPTDDCQEQIMNCNKCMQWANQSSQFQTFRVEMSEPPADFTDHILCLFNESTCTSTILSIITSHSVKLLTSLTDLFASCYRTIFHCT